MLISRRELFGAVAAVAGANALSRVTHAEEETHAPASAVQAATGVWAIDGARPQPGTVVDRPNVVVIMTDDQDFQSYAEPFIFLDRRGRPLHDAGGEPQRGWAMRNLRQYPGGGWTDFRGAFASTAICAPSRASLLTGQYARHHDVLQNGMIGRMDANNTLATWLHAADYYTALFGKYSFGNGDRHLPDQPGWDIFDTGGAADTVFGKAVQFIREATSEAQGRPFALFVTPVDPHRPARPPTRYRRLNLEPPPLPPNVGEADAGKPEWMRRGKPDRPPRRERINAYRALLGVDDGIQAIIDALADTGQLDATVVLVTSDNGYSWASHGQDGKLLPYEEASRVPLLIRLPWLAANQVEERVVSNVDLAPTIAHLTGALPGRVMDGQSLLPLMADSAAPWNEVVFLEGFSTTTRPVAYRGLRTGSAAAGFTYVEWATGERELYDIAADPFQMNNVVNAPAYGDVAAQMAALLAGYEE